MPHIRGGAEVVQVLPAAFAHIIVPEKELNDVHVTVRRVRGGMIESFGQGTEVPPDEEDVMHWFPPPAGDAQYPESA